MQKFSVNQKVQVDTIVGGRYDYEPVYGTIVSVAYHAGKETIYKVQLANQRIVEVSDKKLLELGNKVTGT